MTTVASGGNRWYAKGLANLLTRPAISRPKNFVLLDPCHRALRSTPQAPMAMDGYASRSSKTPVRLDAGATLDSCLQSHCHPSLDTVHLMGDCQSSKLSSIQVIHTLLNPCQPGSHRVDHQGIYYFFLSSLVHLISPDSAKMHEQQMHHARSIPGSPASAHHNRLCPIPYMVMRTQDCTTVLASRTVRSRWLIPSIPCCATVPVHDPRSTVPSRRSPASPRRLIICISLAAAAALRCAGDL